MKKINYLFSVGLFFLLLAAPLAASATANVIVNGDLENPTVVNPYTQNLWQIYGGASAPGIWGPAAPIPGWNPASYQVELHHNLYGSAASGVQYAEIDGPGSVHFTQNVSTTQGTSYVLKFYYAPRPDAGSQSMGIYWNGNQIGTASGTGVPNSGIQWQLKTFTVTATGTTSVLGFGCIVCATGGAGNFIDVISLEPITCSNNAQCGTNAFTGGPFCQANSIYKNFITYTCNNPGTTSSYCSNSISSQLQQTCSGNQTCSGGSCVNQTIACNTNSDCGTNAFTGGPFCQANSIYRNFITYTCNNAGTPQSYCSNSTAAQLQQNCSSSQICSGGSCSNQSTAPSVQTNSATGVTTTSATLNGNLTGLGSESSATVWFQYGPSTAYGLETTHTSQSSAGTFNAGIISLSQNTVYHFRAIAQSNAGTVYGQDVTFTTGINALTATASGSPNPAQTNQTVTFTATPSGGTGSYTYSWTGSCISFNPTCSASYPSPGTYTVFLQVTSGGQTVNTSTAVTVQQQNVNCSTNTDCGTSGLTGSNYCQGTSVYRNYTTYTCNNPGTANSFCSNSTASQLQQTCSANQMCSNGSCTNQNVACSSNSDCGTNAFTGGPFCQASSIYRNFITYTCNNPGTTSSYCSNSTASQFQQTCSSGQTCSNGSCNNQNVTCSSNSDCGANSYIGGSYCQGNSIYRSFKTYTCNNPGTTSSYCSDSTAASFQQNCSSGQTCSNGSCSNNVSGISVVKYVRNVSQGTGWFTFVTTQPGDIVEFKLIISTSSNETNVTIRDTLPVGFVYVGNITVDGQPVSGNILNGLNIGNMYIGQIKTITYQDQSLVYN